MDKDAVIVLDPVNREHHRRAIASGVRDYIGGNCTVSLMLMATIGLFRQGWVEWVNSSTYQAASGAGAKNMRELVAQMRIHRRRVLQARSTIRRRRSSTSIARSPPRQASPDFPRAEFGVPLAASLIPWIDSAVEDGQTREEWKGDAETNKILGNDPRSPSTACACASDAMRCHSQALTIKLKRDVPLDEIEARHRHRSRLGLGRPQQQGRHAPSPLPRRRLGNARRPHRPHPQDAASASEYLGAFTVGDQLLWGAAEPLRRTLMILLDSVG